MVNSVVETNKLTVKYGKKAAKPAVNDVTCSFAPGVTGLLGPNGAGKTTLLKTLLGYLEPTSGSASIFGIDISRRPLTARQEIGYMPEESAYIPKMSAVRFIAYLAELGGLPRTEAVQRAHETLFYVGLGESRYRNLEEYSTGMHQRVKLAQALVHSPRLLLLDEPTSGLDPTGRNEMLDLIIQLGQQRDFHVILSTHLLPDVEKVCENVVVVYGGRVINQGRLEDMRAAVAQKFVVRIHGDQDKFKEAVKAEGCTVEQTDHRMYIIIPAPLDEAFLLELARKTGVQLRQLEKHRPSMEELFEEFIHDASVKGKEAGHADL